MHFLESWLSHSSSPHAHNRRKLERLIRHNKVRRLTEIPWPLQTRPLLWILLLPPLLSLRNALWILTTTCSERLMTRWRRARGHHITLPRISIQEKKKSLFRLHFRQGKRARQVDILAQDERLDVAVGEHVVQDSGHHVLLDLLALLPVVKHFLDALGLLEEEHLAAQKNIAHLGLKCRGELEEEAHGLLLGRPDRKIGLDDILDGHIAADVDLAAGARLALDVDLREIEPDNRHAFASEWCKWRRDVFKAFVMLRRWGKN